MTGTLVNAGAIIAGGLIGLLLRKGIPQRINDAILKIEGLGILLIALNGILTSMMRVGADGRISSSGSLLLLVSLVFGCVAGELLRLDDHIHTFGHRLESRFGADGFSKGFVNASLVFAIGAMGVVGAISDGLTGDSSVLLIKSALDFTTAIILASALGFGVIFASVPVFVIQAAISLLAGLISPYITSELLDPFCMVGYAVVLVIGFNFLCDTRIKTANLLPSLVVPVAYYFITTAMLPV